jgi:WD40-like Beta Propeller Repeat
MIDERERYERAFQQFRMPEPAWDRLVDRRDRKRRNKRIAAGVVGIGVFVATVWIVRDVAWLDRSETSVILGGSNTTGPAETGPAAPVRGFPTDYLLDLETHETTPLPEDIRGDWQNAYAVSPDGSEVAYYGLGEDGGMKDGEYVGLALFVAHIDGTQVQKIADDAVVDGGGRGASDTGPGWSPDGTKIAYTGRPSGDRNTNIFVLDLASGVNTQVTFETVDVSGTEFSPDGSSIVYTAYLREGSEVRIAPATGGEGSTLVGGHGSSASGASFSPDGSLLSFICGDPAFDPTRALTNRDLCLANADGSDPRVIAQAETPHGVGGIPTASWSPDGSQLAYWTFDGVEGVYILDLATGQTTCVVGCELVGAGAWPLGAWPRWLDDHTLLVEAYNGPH